MNIDGSNPVAITSAPVGADCTSGVVCAKWRPTWSPDGKRIAYQDYQGPSVQIYVVSADGSGATRLTSDADNDASPAWSPDDPTDGDPAWSPDGTRVAFDRKAAGSGLSQIFVMNTDGSAVSALTNSPTDEYASPTWSPDGQFIAFGGGKPNVDGDIYVIRLDGTGMLNISNHPGNNWAPSWR